MDDRHLDGDALCDYAEGLLAPGARRDADAHLNGCADCRRELEAVGGYFREMAALPVLKAPEKFLTRVHARIDRASPWKRMLALLSSPRLLPVPLAVLVVAGVGAYLAIVSRDLSGRPQAGSAPAPQEERLATIPPAAAEIRQAEPKPELLDQEPQTGKVKEKKTAGEESAGDQLALATRSPRRKGAAPASPAAGGGTTAAMAPPAPRPAPSEPPLIASVAEASEEAGTALENPDSFEPSLDAEVLSDRARATGGRSDAANDLDESRQAPGSAGEPKAYASSPVAPGKALRKSAPASTLRGKSAKAEAEAERAEEAMAAGEAGGRGPWRVPGLLLEWNPKADPETFFDGIEDLGIRILRSDESRIYRYELLVPAGSLDSLEAFLRAQGKVTRVPKHLAAGRAGGPAIITLRIHGDFSGR